ncbi:hypothetical protein EDC51_11112 [Bibersteinia trehalosi]|nr:hypothetical protein [Bibersteinia trehalosi]TCT13726.1 hypothetical protein EDC51_11112 [Bibersteinia trehalosi]
MLELMDKSPKVNRFLWAILGVIVLYLLLNGLPPLINAILQWQQLTAGK